MKSLHTVDVGAPVIGSKQRKIVRMNVVRAIILCLASFKMCCRKQTLDIVSGGAESAVGSKIATTSSKKLKLEDKDREVSESSGLGSFRFLPMTERGDNAKSKEASEDEPKDEISEKDEEQTKNSSFSVSANRGLVKAPLQNGTRIIGGRNEQSDTSSEDEPKDEISEKDGQQTKNSSFSVSANRGLVKAPLQNGSDTSKQSDTSFGTTGFSKKLILEDKDGEASESSGQESLRFLPLTEHGGNGKAKQTLQNEPTDEILEKDGQQTKDSSFSVGANRGLEKAPLENAEVEGTNKLLPIEMGFLWDR